MKKEIFDQFFGPNNEVTTESTEKAGSELPKIMSKRDAFEKTNQARLKSESIQNGARRIIQKIANQQKATLLQDPHAQSIKIGFQNYNHETHEALKLVFEHLQSLGYIHPAQATDQKGDFWIKVNENNSWELFLKWETFEQ